MVMNGFEGFEVTTKNNNKSFIINDLVFNVIFSVDDSREIVNNNLIELHISDDSNEALISNLQSA